MRIIVFGASGRLGRQVVRRAAEGGHSVTAFVRSPEKLDLDALGLSAAARDAVVVRQGDALDADAVAEAVIGHDAIISAVGGANGLRAGDDISRMVGKMADAALAAGVNRIVHCASAGVDGELTGLIGRAVMWVLRHPLADHRAALERIQAAGLDATIVRPMSLTDGDFAPDYVEVPAGPPATSKAIPRASVADAMVRALEQPDDYIGASVGLSLA